ncbi:MAG: response regulator [Bdellovibrionota bacterium]
MTSATIPEGPYVFALDDDEATLALFEKIATDLGACYEGFSRMKDLRARLRWGTPHVLVLDWLLPDGKGTDILADASIHSSPAKPLTLFHSAFCTRYHDFQELRRIGVDRVLPKPARAEQIERALSELLARACAPLVEEEPILVLEPAEEAAA